MTPFKPALFVLAATLCPLANASELTRLNSEWLFANAESISQTLAESTIQAMPVINTLGTLWLYRDGALAAEVSFHIAQALVQQPEAMLAWFASHPQAFSEWLEGLPADLFTNYSGDPDYTRFLEMLRARVIEAMVGYAGPHEELAQDVLAAVQQVSVSEVD